MALISDSFHKEKLKKYGLNIKTKYIVGNKILERNTDNSVNDDIIKGIRCEKKYYLNSKLVHTENIFDSRIEYSFVVQDDINKEYSCDNCGMTADLKEFIDGCPYCNTHYNIDYSDKELGSKYHYDLVLKSNTYKVVTAIVDFIVSIVSSFLFIKYTSRTFNNFDIIKVFIYGGILSLVLYYAFYILDAYIILKPIKKYKEKMNKRQKEFWLKTKIDKKHFFNNLNYEIRKYYYSKENIIDYDILDYLDFKDSYKDGIMYVYVTVQLRIVTIENNKIKSNIIKDVFVMQRQENGILKLDKGANVIQCLKCGASISAIDGMCSYCNTKIECLQEWGLINKN